MTDTEVRSRRRTLRIFGAGMAAVIVGSFWVARRFVAASKRGRRRSVAVFPFETSGPRAGVGWAVAATLHERLGLLGSLQVEPFPPSEKATAEYGLHGSVTVVSEQITVDARLVETATGNGRWSERFDGTLADLFAIERTLAQKAAAALGSELTEAGRLAFSRQQTAKLEAYLAYGDALRERAASPEGGCRALAEALRLDPAFEQARQRRALWCPGAP